MKADASPTRAFFVRMLTRDISLDDCILDLVDNSIDGAWESSGERPSVLTTDQALSRFAIDIQIDEHTFKISDNCGGITLTDAADYAFTFGRKESEPRSEYTVGVYGIGMKRAVFKLGNSIRIVSTYQDNDRLVGFLVPIDVNEWVSDTSDRWDFDLEEHAPTASPGVQIEVKDLSEETSKRFQDPTYERTLRTVLARDYLLPLMRGLRITVNGTSVKGQSIEWQQSGNLAPLRHSYEDEDVKVEIVAGMSSAPPESTDPDEPTRVDRTSGWYVICNGRAVLAADRSIVTGWGSYGWPIWHNQYNGFIGIILFSAADPSKLPMTTTKRSVDVSSAIYTRALVQMEKPTRAWIDYTNIRKYEREQAERLERLDSSRVPLAEVKESASIRLPRLTASPKREPVANVNYAVPRKKMLKLASAFGSIDMPYKEVGTKSFDYAYDEFVDEDE